MERMFGLLAVVLALAIIASVTMGNGMAQCLDAGYSNEVCFHSLNR